MNKADFSLFGLTKPQVSGLLLDREQVLSQAPRLKLRRRVGCKWLVTCEDFAAWAKGRSQKGQRQGRP